MIDGTPALEIFCLQANVIPGNTYPISLQGNTDGNWYNYFRVYIDWNQNGTYGDANETYDIGFIYNSTGTDGDILNGNIAVPGGALTGLTRMRVVKNFNTYSDACSTEDWGQAEDYVVNVYTPSPCSGTPTGGTTTVNPTSGTPGSNYTVSATGYTIGTGLTYQWQYRINAGAWTPQGAATPTYSNYLATAPSPVGTTVDWQLVVKCTNSDLFSNSSVATFTSGYCTPLIGNSYSPSFNYINTVKFLGTLNDVTNTSTYTNNPRGYQDFTSLPNKSIQAQGEGINVYVGTVYSGYYKAWVDWNKDGDFTDSGELVYDAGGVAQASTTFGFVIPENTVPGDYRVRIRMNHQNGSYNFDSCEVLYNEGETEDYLFTVIPKCNAKITSVIPGSNCGPGNVDVIANGNAGTAKIRWYDQETGGTYLGESNPGVAFSVQNLTADKMVYAAAYSSADNCESTFRQQVRAEIKALPNINFTASETEICGETSIVRVAAQGDDETVFLINEEFEIDMGGFTVGVSASPGVSGATQNGAKWQRRASTFQPTGPSWRPAISSGINGNYFVMATTDFQDLNGRSLTTTLESLEMNTNGFQNLTLKLKMYFSHYYADNTQTNTEYVVLEYNTGGPTWNQIPGTKITQDVGNGTRFENLTYDFTPYVGNSNFKFRIRYTSNWTDGVAVDNIQLFGTRPLSPTFSWDNSQVSVYLDANGTQPYQGEQVPEVYIRPNIDQLEQNENIIVAASADLTNGCSASGSISLPNKTKVWNPASGTDWADATNSWKPSVALPTATNCVIVKKPVNLNSGTAGLAKSLLVTSDGELYINDAASLTVTDFIKNEATVDDFIVRQGGNLVQIDDNAINTGSITAEKEFVYKGNSVPVNQLQYNFTISPVVGQNVRLIYSPTPSTNAQAYNEGTNYFDNVNGDYVLGKGFAVREPNNRPAGNATAKYKGAPFNGVASIPITRTSLGYNLIGNPYPSAIDIKAIYDANSTKIHSNIYFWDNINNTMYTQQGTNYDGTSYAIFNAVANAGVGAGERLTSPSNNSKVPNRYVTKGTGFIVQKLLNGSGTLTLNNLYRKTSAGIEFAGKGNFNPEADDRYWLTITTPTDFQRMMVVTYIPNGNDAYWNDDSETMAPSDDLYSIVEGYQLSIQGKRPFRQEDEVPIGYRAFDNGTHIISVLTKEGIFAEEQDIFLIDHLLSKIWNLSQRPYKFTTRSGEYNSRFTVVYRPRAFGSDFAKNEISLIKKDKQIVISSSIDKISEIEIFDINSRSVYKKSDIGSNEHKVSAALFDHQVIVVTVKTETGEFVTKKFVNK